jgi:dTDP-glucose 4,6-dehydratase
MKKVLVTGGHGFIGSHVIEELLKREDVKHIYNIDNLGIGSCSTNVPYSNKITNFIIDLKSKVAVMSAVRDVAPTHIIHLAAESHVDRSITSPTSFIETNVMGTTNLLEAARIFVPAARIIHVSTDEVYGHLESVDDDAFNEDTPLDPRSPYSSSKASSDLIALSYRSTYGSDITVTRCCNNYGERQFDEKFIPTIVKSIVSGVKIPVYGTGMNIREWIYVKDHANALIEIAFDNSKKMTVCNIPGSIILTNLELIEKIVKVIEYNYPQYKKEEYFTLVEDRLSHDFCYKLESNHSLKSLSYQELFNDAIVSTVDFFVTKFSTRSNHMAE